MMGILYIFIIKHNYINIIVTSQDYLDIILKNLKKVKFTNITKIKLEINCALHNKIYKF